MIKISTQIPIQWVPMFLCCGLKGQAMKVITPYFARKLKMRSAVPALHNMRLWIS